ncbi:MAG: hypothetical protein RJB26_1440 [Pseudomonadota bacterium]|jgi:hypothetical protein
MALIAGYGGTVAFSGTSAVACRSVTITQERASLDVTQLGDYIEKRAAGRARQSGSLTLYRQDSTVDNALRAHILPTSLTNAVTTTATLTFTYTDQGSQAYGSWNIIITSATLTDDGTGAATWELTFERAS